jgi:beta-glucosidase
VLGIVTGHARQEITPFFRNPDKPLEVRLNDLVSRMTLDEKTGQMLYNAPAIDRLGIPAYNWWNEALHGVARSGKATVFPQAIGLAATWDTSLMRRVSTAISDEARAKYNYAIRNGRHGIYEGLTFWSPNINLFRDPRWGRGMETYGEDPFLTGRMAVEFIKGMQGDDPQYLKTVATPKHFAVHSGPEPDRHTFDAVVSERDLRDTYLPQFRAAVVEGHAHSVMCAYNRFRGSPCCGSDELLQKILRNEWGFDGYVVSDCWAIMDFYTTHKVVETAPEAAAMALKAGTDLNCGVTYDSLGVAVRSNLVGEELVDKAVKRLMRARFRLGMFDPPGRVPYAKIPITVVDSKEHRLLALEAARKSIVLLKNEAQLLPLKKEIRTIAVIGPNADDRELLLGNYNGIPSRSTTPLEGIRAKVGGKAEVLYSRGCDVAQGVPALETIPSIFLTAGAKSPGLQGSYFDNNSISGAPALTRYDSLIDFCWFDQPASVKISVDTFSVRWTGFLTPVVSGKFALGVTSLGESRLYIDDSIFVESRAEHDVGTAWKYISLAAGEPRKIRLEYRHLRADAMVRLVWAPPAPHQQEDAINIARRADVIVACLGLSPRLEGEEMDVKVPGFLGGDRTDLGLPQTQEMLLESLATAGKPIVLVLLNGSAVAVNWAAAHIPAIVEAWYPGEEAGNAIADVLFGDFNPSGRLPVTFYKSTDQLPPFSDYRMTGRTYRYFTGDPLYRFGYGLSYTHFAFTNISLPQTVVVGESISVSADVHDTGDREGDEVVELYLSRTDGPADLPLRALVGLQRVSLHPGEKKRVRFVLPPGAFSYISDSGARTVEAGSFQIYVGGRQPLSGPAGNDPGIVSGVVKLTGKTLVLDK